ncbi:MAG TPA: cytochrome ubiquinol oxidase subunit I [Corynebacteriales bacterium]|nr:cytochrome ubiquinol oxidase subunit I [Mycobacteriales bacterium]
MDVLDLSRWQFGITTVYHFIFVPLTLGLTVLVAIMQSMWMGTKKEGWYRATKFFGKLMTINFILGVVTGIVQEFQFGMNWSGYSRYVGDVFGAPLAFEGLMAFFLESTFLGLWLFGWGRLNKKVHLATVWLFSIATNISAFWIITANGFMQHPVGAEFNPGTGRAELVDFGALLTNPFSLIAFAHVIAAAFLLSSVFVAGIAGWWMARIVRNKNVPAYTGKEATGTLTEEDARTIFRPTFRMGLLVMIIAGLLTVASGHVQMQWVFEDQPMKGAAAEMVCETTEDPNFSVLSTTKTNSCEDVNEVIGVPAVLSLLLEFKPSGVTVQGVENAQKHYETIYGPGDYRPNLLVTYWMFRLMMLSGAFAVILALAGLWVTRKGKMPSSKGFGRLAILCIPGLFFGNAFGWIMTEMGRQPWIVHPNPAGDPRIHLTVAEAVSPLEPYQVWISVVGFTLVYLILFVVWYYLMHRYVVTGPLETDRLSPVAVADSADSDSDSADSGEEADDDASLSFAY